MTAVGRGCAVLLALCLSAASGAAQDAGFAFEMRATPTQAMAPLTFVDPAGDRHRLEDYRGQFVLLNIWATWCAPCREELPTLSRLQTALDDVPFQVIALSTDTGRLIAVQRLYRELGLDETGIFIDDTGSAMRSLTVFALPTTILLNPDGQEIGRFVGPAVWDSPAAQSFFRTIVAAAEGNPGVTQ